MKEKWKEGQERIFKNTYSSGKCEEDQKENSSFHNEGGNRRRARSL